MKRLSVLSLLWLLMAAMPLHAESIRGEVKDALTGEPLTGATVAVLGSDLTVLSVVNEGGTATPAAAVADIDGRFLLQNIPTGRYTVEARCMGFETEQQVEVLVAGRHEIVLSFNLREKTSQMTEVTVKPVVNKSRPLNPTALAGAQMISVEEAQRFGGTMDDIGRVVRRYVGTTGSESNSGISTHGNAPSMTMYRLEGVEVPAPAHFDNMAHGVGDISSLHTNLIANSDYYTAAAPAEFGNTLGGVMDLQLRNGNLSKYEHSVKLSTMGLDLNSEGPISKEKGFSYLIAYRYGLTKLANDIGLGILDGDQGDYQDLAFKLNFPLRRATISVWGLGAWDHGYMEWSGYENQWHTLYDQNDFNSRLNTTTGGATIDASPGNGWRLKANLTASLRNFRAEDRYVIFADDGTLLTNENRHEKTWAEPTPFTNLRFNTTWLTASMAAQKRFSPVYLLKFGASERHIIYDQTLCISPSLFTGTMVPVAEADRSLEQVDAYASNFLRLGRWTLNAGLHLSGWSLSNDWTLQPRISAEWKPAEAHTLSAGYGMTTRTETLDTYFSVPGNQDLDPMRSHQLVLNYKWQIKDDLHFSAEAWGEWQTSLPVSPTGTFSSINRRLYFLTDRLVNEGEGRGYGISAGVEQHMRDGLYWLLNGSVFKNEYRAVDGIWRPTLFDRGWAVNVACGKEWSWKRSILSVNLAASIMGGMRQSPFDEAGSAAMYAAGSPYVAYDDFHAMSERTDAVHDLSLNISYRLHGKRIDHILGLDFMNIIGYEEPLQDYYNYHTLRVNTITSCYSIPNISYAIVF